MIPQPLSIKIEKEEKAEPFDPMAKWYLFASSLGLSTFFYLAGYAVYKGHILLLGLPTTSLAASSEYTTYLGLLWFWDSLSWAVSEMVTWVILVLLLLLLLLAPRLGKKWRQYLDRQVSSRPRSQVWPRLQKVRLTPNRQKIIVLVGLICLSRWLISYEMAHLQFTIGVFAKQDGRAQAIYARLFTGASAPLFRQGDYRNINLVACFIALGLGFILVCPPRMKTPWRALAGSFLTLIATVLGTLAILLWPACYGRLRLPYARPVLEIRQVTKGKPQISHSMVLNPNGDRWMLSTKQSFPNHSTTWSYRICEPKDLGTFQFEKKQEILDWLTPQKITGPKRPRFVAASVAAKAHEIHRDIRRP